MEAIEAAVHHREYKKNTSIPRPLHLSIETKEFKFFVDINVNAMVAIVVDQIITFLRGCQLDFSAAIILSSNFSS